MGNVDDAVFRSERIDDAVRRAGYDTNDIVAYKLGHHFYKAHIIDGHVVVIERNNPQTFFLARSQMPENADVTEVHQFTTDQYKIEGSELERAVERALNTQDKS